jgi:glycosyltransferase involved in cell wall biosynthesis
MNIGLIMPGFSADESDWCIPAQLNLVRRLTQRADVRVFPLRYPHRQSPYVIYGADVYPQGGAETRGFGRFAMLSRAVSAVIAAHRRRRFDVLHAMWADEPGFVAVTAGRLLGVPSVVSLLGGELVGFPDIDYGVQLRRIGRMLVRKSMRSATRVLSGSTYIHRLAEPLVPGNRLAPLPIGVDSERFERPPQNGDHPSVLRQSSFVGQQPSGVNLLHAASLVPVKDQSTLLRAFAQIVPQTPGAHLHIVGSGPLRRDLEALGEVQGVADRITFYGAVPYHEMVDYYHAADLFVLPSRHEGQGLVTLEAAVCGRATVGTAVGMLPDIAPERAVPPGDWRALAEAVLTALRDGPAELGQASKAVVEQRYTLTQTVEALMELYEGLGVTG